MAAPPQPSNVWQHVSLLAGGLAAAAVGAVDALTRQKLGAPVDLGLLFGGLTALGVHVSGVLPP